MYTPDSAWGVHRDIFALASAVQTEGAVNQYRPKSRPKITHSPNVRKPVHIIDEATHRAWSMLWPDIVDPTPTQIDKPANPKDIP